MKSTALLQYAQHETRRCLHHFKTNLRRAAKNPRDPDALHDLRVSIRRLTQCFRVFHPPVQKMRRRLHKIMEHCGAVRNLDIALELLVECGLPGSPSVPKLHKSREDAARKLHRFLKKESRKHHRASSNPSDTWRIASRLPALAEDFFETGDVAAAPHSSYHTLHRFRLRAKRFRYTLELFERFYGGAEMATAAKSLKEVQDRLGAINDCVMTISLLGDDASSAAAIQQRLVERTHAFRTHWRTRFSPQKRAWWLHWLTEPRTPVGGGPSKQL